MPASSPSPARTASGPGVVVVEEYSALAAAIGSALRKFAPQNQAHFARSLAEAGALLKKAKPGLFILDFDPPHPGAIPFLATLSTKHPDARMLVIAPGISREVAAEVGSTGGIQLIDKPFDLAEFGAAVQALLGPWTTTNAKIRGALRDLNLIDVLHIMSASGETIVIEVSLPDGRSGEVHVAAGQVLHARTGKLSGMSALQAMVCWRGGRLSEGTAPKKATRTIQGGWKKTLLEAVRYSKAARADVEPEVVPEASKAEPPPPRSGKKLVVIDDTEMLLIFVEDVLATDNPQLQITTAPNATIGFREVETLQPDLVLLDYSLPDFNGDELCQKLLANKKTAGIPVLMMSGHVPEMTAAAIRLPNIVATIAKPFLSGQLVDVVRTALNAGRLPAKSAVVHAPLPATPPLQVAKPAPAKQTIPADSLPPVVAPPAHVAPPLPPVLKSPPAKVEPRPVKRAGATPMPIAPAVAPAVERKMPGWRRLATQAVSAVRSVAPAPTLEAAPAAPKPTQIRTPKPVGPAFAADGSEVVLGLALEVISMQLTSSLRIGSIRVRPAAHTVALRFSSATVRGAIPTESGFELGPVELNGEGGISIIRVIPTMRPPNLPMPRLAFEISDVSVVATNSHNRVQIMSAPAAPMTMQLLAHFQLRSVELSPTFQVAALALSGDHNAVRISLDAKTTTHEQSATDFDITSIELDGFARIAALQLTARS